MVAKAIGQDKDDLERLRPTFPGVDQLASQLDANTCKRYLASGLLYLTWCAGDTDQAHDPHTLRAWRQHMAEALQLSPSTIRQRLVAIKSLIRTSAAGGALPRGLSDAFRRVEHVPRPQPQRRPGRPPGKLSPATRERLAGLFPGLHELPGRLAPRSVQGYYYDALGYVDWCGWDRERTLDPQTFRAWLQQQVEAGLSPNTINRRRACLLTLIRVSAACEALDERLVGRFTRVEAIKVAPLRERLKQPEALTPHQVRALCKAPDASTLIGLRDRAMLTFLASSGCRLHEVIGVEQSHLVASGNAWRVALLGKGQAKARQAPLSLEAYTWLQRWLRARTAAGIQVPRIFTQVGNPYRQPTAQSLSLGIIWRRVKLYGRQIGLPRLAPHDLRRFVAQQVTARYDVRTAQQVLGHAKIETTILYLSNEMPDGTTEGLF